MDKKKLFIIGISLIVVLGIIALFVSKKPTTLEVDKLNEEILKDYEVANIKISDQAVITNDNVSTYVANVSNFGDTNYHIDFINIIFTVDNFPNKVMTLANYDLKSNETKPIIVTLDIDISKATKVEYEIVKDGAVVK